MRVPVCIGIRDSVNLEQSKVFLRCVIVNASGSSLYRSECYEYNDDYYSTAGDRATIYFGISVSLLLPFLDHVVVSLSIDLRNHGQLMQFPLILGPFELDICDQSFLMSSHESSVTVLHLVLYHSLRDALDAVSD